MTILMVISNGKKEKRQPDLRKFQQIRVRQSTNKTKILYNLYQKKNEKAIIFITLDDFYGDGSEHHEKTINKK